MCRCGFLPLPLSLFQINKLYKIKIIRKITPFLSFQLSKVDLSQSQSYDLEQSPEAQTQPVPSFLPLVWITPSTYYQYIAFYSLAPSRVPAALRKGRFFCSVAFEWSALLNPSVSSLAASSRF